MRDLRDLFDEIISLISRALLIFCAFCLTYLIWGGPIQMFRWMLRLVIAIAVWGGAPL